MLGEWRDRDSLGLQPKYSDPCLKSIINLPGPSQGCDCKGSWEGKDFPLWLQMGHHCTLMCLFTGSSGAWLKVTETWASELLPWAPSCLLANWGLVMKKNESGFQSRRIQKDGWLIFYVWPLCESLRMTMLFLAMQVHSAVQVKRWGNVVVIMVWWFRYRSWSYKVLLKQNFADLLRYGSSIRFQLTFNLFKLFILALLLP